MMKSTRLWLTAGLIVGLLAPVWAFPQMSSGQEMSAQDKQMLEMMEKYGTPGKEHEFLKKFVGDWMVEMKSWMKPGDPPMMSKGTIKTRPIFDGRYVEGRFEGMMMDRKYLGLEIIGFDRFQKKYITLWIDTMGTGFFTTSGMLDASGMVLTETGTMPDPMTGGTQKVKDVTTFMPDGSYKFEMFMVMPDGKEFKSMEFVAKKKM